MNSLQAADVAPTVNVRTAVQGALTTADAVLARWGAVRKVDLAALNATLKAANLGEIKN